jgi:hypothetical protein
MLRIAVSPVAVAVPVAPRTVVSADHRAGDQVRTTVAVWTSMAAGAPSALAEDTAANVAPAATAAIKTFLNITALLPSSAHMARMKIGLLHTAAPERAFSSNASALRRVQTGHREQRRPHLWTAWATFFGGARGRAEIGKPQEAAGRRPPGVRPKGAATKAFRRRGRRRGPSRREARGRSL